MTMSEDTSEQQQHDHSGTYMGLHAHDGGAMHWHDEFGEHMAEDLTEEEFAARQLDWQMHNVQIVTVGVDIGSSTTHLMFSKIYMQLVGEAPNVRSVVVGREILWQSPIVLTPYLDDDTIDAEALRKFMTDAYAEVGATANEVDTGAIILTGEALKRKNSRALVELFALESGKFVCASAGHHMEAVLAANGSGTVARSWRDAQTLLNVDIGGGTTKLALVRDGQVLATAAVAVGARLIARDSDGRLVRIDEPARRVAEHLGITLTLGESLSRDDEKRIVETWVDILAGLVHRKPPEGLTADLMLTDPLPESPPAQALTFSGGVSEFIFFRESADFGDLGKPLSRAIRGALSDGRITLPAIIDPNLGIRATAIGASMFTVQVGFNVYLSSELILPMINVPVLVPTVELYVGVESEAVAKAIRDALLRADLEEGEQPLALFFEWLEETADPALVRSVSEGIRDALPRTIEAKVPFVLLVDQLAAQALGSLLKDEMGVPGELIALEGVGVSEFDFIDVAEVIHPSEVVPVSIKSLLFAGGLDRRSVKQALREALKSSRT